MSDDKAHHGANLSKGRPDKRFFGAPDFFQKPGSFDTRPWEEVYHAIFAIRGRFPGRARPG